MSIVVKEYASTPEIEEVGEKYDALTKIYDTGNAICFDLATKALGAYGIGPGSHVLEIGPATGRFAEQAVKMLGLSHYTVIEPSKDQIVQMKIREPWLDNRHLSIHNGGLYSPGLLDRLPKSSFNAVVMMFVGDEVHKGNEQIERIKNPAERMQRVLTDLKGLLAPGGIVITADITDPKRLANAGIGGQVISGLNLLKNLVANGSNPPRSVWIEYSSAMWRLIKTPEYKELSELHAEFGVKHRPYVNAAERVFGKDNVWAIPLTPEMSFVVSQNQPQEA